jgi:2-phosphoglycolate phosphatase
MVRAPRGIVFDLDGTLIDSSGDIVAALNHALVATKREALPFSTALTFVGDGARVLCARATNLPAKHPEVDRVLQLYLAHYEAHPIAHTKWLPHARAVLDQLGGYALALCTNKPRAITDLVLGRLGVRSLFASVVAGGDVALVKPAPEPVLEVARVLDLDPEELVMVGDGPQDVEAGRGAGARTVGVYGGFASPERLLASRPDELISALSELPALVRRWSEAATRAR